LRTAFRNTAFWVADLVTDVEGRARAEFKFPDDITSWRFTARGVTPDTLVGAVRAIHRTILPVQAEFAVPRALRVGDRVVAGVLAHNNEGGARTLSIQVSGDAGETVRELAVAQNGCGRLDFPLAPQTPAGLKLRARVEDRAAQQADALERTWAVLPRGYPQARNYAGRLAEGGAIALDLGGEAEPGSLRLEIGVEPGFAGPVVSALDSLIQYPYGCVEQTMSRFLPAVVAGRAMERAKLTCSRMQELPAIYRKGIERLAGFQHPDGGWGWWKEDRTNDFMTAYVMEGLGLCRDAGQAVPSGMLERGEGCLSERLLHGHLSAARSVYSIGEVSLPVYAAHALALCYAADPERYTAQRARLRVVLEQLKPEKEWTVRDRALLASTWNRLGFREKALQHLPGLAVPARNGPSFMRTYFLTAAAILEAGAALEPNRPDWLRLARELVGLRQGRSWGDTLTDAAAVRALSALLASGGQGVGPVEVLADGKVVARLEPPPSERGGLTLTREILGAKQVVLKALNGGRDSFWSARLSGFLKKPPAPAPQPAAEIACRVFTTGADAREVLAGAGGVLKVKSGATLRVRLVCRLDEAQIYLRISFPRPCGVELVRPPKLGDGLVAFEQQDDGLHFFADAWQKGAHEVEFLVRAEAAGRVFAPPPELEPMYAASVPLRVLAAETWEIEK